MMKLEQLQKILRTTNIAKMARETGLAKHTIHRIARGEAKTPTYRTVKTILDYLASQDAPK